MCSYSIFLQNKKCSSLARFEMEQLKRSIKEEANAFQQQILNSNLNHQSNSLADQQSDPSSKSYLTQWLDNLVERLISRTLSILHFNNNPSTVSNTFEYHFLMTIIAQQLSSTAAAAANSNLLNGNSMLSSNASSKARSSSYNLIKPHGLSNSLFNANDYSMALSLVIAIGLMLLLLNIVVFVTVYAHRKRKANRAKKEERKDDSSNGKANNATQKKPRKKASIDSTNNNLDSSRNSVGTTSYLPMSGSLANQLTNSLANAYSTNQQTNQSGPASIYGPSAVPHTAYYYNSVTNNDLNCLTAANVTGGQQASALNALNNGTLRRGGELDFSDYCCSSANEQHLCIYNSADRTGAAAGATLNANSLNANTDLNRCSTNSDTTNSANGQHSTVNCLSQNSQLSGISCQCDNCTTIHTLNSNSPLANQLLNNGLVAGQAALLNANLVNLVNSGLCDSNQCNLTVIHEFE